MKVNMAIKRMMEQSRTSGTELSNAIGRDRNAVTTMFSRNSVPRVDTLAKMCERMGYRIVLKSDSDEIEIDPPGEEH